MRNGMKCPVDIRSAVYEEELFFRLRLKNSSSLCNALFICIYQYVLREWIVRLQLSLDLNIFPLAQNPYHHVIMSIDNDCKKFQS